MFKIRIRQRLYSGNPSRRRTTFASGATLRPKRCTDNHARATRRALETGKHPADSGLLRPSPGSTHPRDANGMYNRFPSTESLDPFCPCCHPSARDDAGRGDKDHSAAWDWSLRKRYHNGSNLYVQSPTCALIFDKKLQKMDSSRNLERTVFSIRN